MDATAVDVVVIGGEVVTDDELAMMSVPAFAEAVSLADEESDEFALFLADQAEKERDYRDEKWQAWRPL